MHKSKFYIIFSKEYSFGFISYPTANIIIANKLGKDLMSIIIQ